MLAGISCLLTQAPQGICHLLAIATSTMALCSLPRGKADPRAGSSKGRTIYLQLCRRKWWPKGMGCSSRSPSSYYCFSMDFPFSAPKGRTLLHPSKLAPSPWKFMSQVPSVACQFYNVCGLCKSGISPSCCPNSTTVVRVHICQKVFKLAISLAPQAFWGLGKVGLSPVFVNEDVVVFLSYFKSNKTSLFFIWLYSSKICSEWKSQRK